MKILHLADLHIGKKIGKYSLLDDQRDFFNKTMSLIKSENIDLVIVAGDIYDVAAPGAEATGVFAKFLDDLSDNNVRALIIPGNHDMADRFAYANNALRRTGIHIIYDVADSLTPISINNIDFYLIPFVNHHDINRVLDTDHNDYATAMEDLIDHMELDESRINIAIAHQTILNGDGTNPITGGSEQLSIGTLQNIPSAIFSKFDYVALGHIHKSQNVSNNMRYSGSPLAYHSDEGNQDKMYTIIDTSDKENIKVDVTHKITPLRKVTVLEGSLEDVLTKHPENKDDYIHVKLHEEHTIERLMDRLKAVYPYACGVDYVNEHTAKGVDTNVVVNIDDIDVNDLFASFFSDMFGAELNEEQKAIVEQLLEEGDEE